MGNPNNILGSNIPTLKCLSALLKYIGPPTPKKLILSIFLAYIFWNVLPVFCLFDMQIVELYIYSEASLIRTHVWEPIMIIYRESD